MSLTLEPPSRIAQAGDKRERRLRGRAIRDADRRILVGLVNNMPDPALAATERQFIRLLEDAGADYDVRLRLYALDSVPRSLEARRRMQATYHRARGLRVTRLDALIVTGAEPRAPSLRDEPYWRELVDVFDLARAQTRSTIFSCLAAHAAVLHWDAVSRIPLTGKLSGVFGTRVVRRHPLVDGFPVELSIPQSRLNSLDETALANKGYATLVRSDEAGVDVFVKDEASLLVFLQGHPEYDADSLAREFRRDLSRYLAGEREAPPNPPANYFAADVLAEVEALIKWARRERRPDLAGCFAPAALNKASVPSWRAHSQRLYRNWLTIVAERKTALQPLPAVARWGG
jgi:homoserine O-succinyltransferase/O-acetyltransferase